MSEQRPAFPFYPKDWLASARVASMPLAAQGLYVRLMAYAWQSDGLPTDEAALQRLVGIDRTEWRRLWPSVRPMWDERDGRLFNRKLEHVREESAAFTEAKRHAGAASARARKAKYGSAQPPNTTPNTTRTGFRTEARTEPRTVPEPASASALTDLDTNSVCTTYGDRTPSAEHTHTGGVR